MRVAVQTQKADAESSLRVANAEARISALEQKERTGVDPGGCGSAEEDVNVEVQRLEHQEAAANEIASHKNTHSAPFQEIEEKENVLDCTATAAQQDTGLGKAIRGIQMELSVQRFSMSDMRRPFRAHSTAVESQTGPP